MHRNHSQIKTRSASRQGLLRIAAIRCYTLVCIAALFALPHSLTLASSSETVIPIEAPINRDLGPAMHFFTDDTLTWQSLSKLPIEAGIPSRAGFFSADDYQMPMWMRVDLVTGALDPNDTWLMGLGNGFGGDVELYVVADEKLITESSLSPHNTHSERPYDHQLVHFPLILPSHTNVSLLVKFNYAPIPHYRPTITTEKLLTKTTLQWMTWNGFALGFLFAIGAYHLVLASAARDKVYLYYFIYILGSALWFIELHGIGFKYIWPSAPWVEVYFSTMLYYSPVWLSILFVINFLELRKLSAWLARYFYGIGALLLFQVLYKLYDPSMNISVMSLTVLLAYLSFACAGFYAQKKGIEYARFFTLAWTLYCLSIINMMLHVSGLPALFPDYTYWVTVIIFDVQVLLLALALAHRIRSIRQSKLEAEADSRAQSEFLAHMSHEIRTPLSGVLGMTELLADRLQDKTDKYYLSIIRSSGASLLTIINDILDYSKFTSGKMELESIPFNLQKLAVECLDVFKVKAADKSIELIANIDSKIPHTLLGDPTRLKQIMLNFVSNAIKFTDQGQVVLGAERISDNSNQIKIYVKDSGRGISTEAQVKLFKAFSQASKATARHHGGTGLGLSICKQLVTLMGGNIGVDSEEKNGSTFWINVELPPGKSDEPESKAADIDLKGFNLLIVEDNYTFAELLLNQATLWGMTCQVAKNGGEAISLLNQNYEIGHQFDLISLDLVMPKMDGLETSRHINTDPRFKDIPRILLTSATNYPSQNVLASSGILRVMEKPVLPADLQQVYKELLTASRTDNNDSVLIQSDTNSSLPTLSILVAEDNKVNQVVIQGILKRFNQHITIVENGEQVLDAMTKQSPAFDLILMDYDMPVMDGVTATKEIRRQEKENSLPHIPIVALTAHAIKSHIDDCFTAGMDAYLAKPIDIKLIEELLRGFPNTVVSTGQKQRVAG